MFPSLRLWGYMSVENETNIHAVHSKDDFLDSICQTALETYY